MRIENESALDRCRYAVACEYCGKKSRTGRDPAHIFPRGLGDAKRLDIDVNLVALCREDHSRSHAGGSPTKSELLAIAAEREKTTVEAITEVVHFILRQPKGTVLAKVDVSELSDEAVLLLKRTTTAE